MLMIMWIYRVVFANFVYFASSGVLFVIGLFMLKRGVYSRRPALRQLAFGMIFVAVFKVTMLDVRFAKRYLICDFAGDADIPLLPCSARGMMTADFLGMLLFVLGALAIFQAYRVWMPDRKIELQRPDQVSLRFWANFSLWMVIAMLCWLAAPWLGFLTVGYVPRIFTAVPWQAFAVVNIALLLLGFWKSESCAWSFDILKKDKMRHLNETWTPRDTLWLNVFLYVIALALCYVSHDILTPAGPATEVQQQPEP